MTEPPRAATDRKAALMRASAGFRHGVVMPPRQLDLGPAEVPDLFHVSVPPAATATWATVCGGIGRDAQSAELAAIGEALERYCATVCQLPGKRRAELPPDVHVLDITEFALFSPAQRADPAFPYAALYDDELDYTNVFSLHDNQEVWLPSALVPLRATAGVGIATSSGLACERGPLRALRRALQEVIERDALMTTWLHGLPGQQRPLGAERLAPLLERGGQVVCVDATPAYSAFPVAVVAGSLPARGRPRIALGAACRARWEDALEKAYLEWAQGTVYAGHIARERPTLRFDRYEDAITFEDHAAYYTVQPEQWPAVPLPRGGPAQGAPVEAQGTIPAAQLAEALARLRAHNVRVYYRDLTTIELRQLGLTCVRVLSPDLTPIHCDQRWPFLGGRAADVLWRYPWARDCPRTFPNPLPHPLG